jgi:hypothetical protein
MREITANLDAGVAQKFSRVLFPQRARLRPHA